MRGKPAQLTLPFLSTLVLFLSVVTGVFLVQQQQELRTKAAGNSFFVAPNGSDSNPGTLARPWRTIGKANRTLQAGDTVRVRSGTYNEVIEPARSGSSGNPITYTNYQNEEAIIRGNNAQKYLARITGSYTILDGLTFRHGFRVQGQSGWISIESGSSRFNIIRNNRITIEDAELQWSLSKKDKYKDRGIIVKRATDTLIENNLIRGMQIGVSVWRNGQRTIIRGNTITETFQSPIVVGGSTGTPTIQGILIENNILEKSLIEDGIQFHQNFDLPRDQQEKDVSAIGIVVRNNIFRYNAENAIDLKGAGNIVIEGNIIYGTEGDNDGPLECGCHCAGNGNDRCSFSTIIRGSRTTSRDVIIRNNVLYDNPTVVTLYAGWKVYNNTMVGNNRDFSGPNSTWAGASNAGFHGVKSLGSRDNGVKNNIIVEENHAEIYMNVGSMSRLDINNNLYWNSRGANFRNTADNRTFNNRNFEQWKSDLRGNSAISGNDEQSLVCKPEFVNVPSSLRPVGVHTNFDFRYKGNCPIVGASLTQTVGASSGRQIRVGDARFFFDGFGVVAGDQIIVGNNSAVTATAINYSTNTITVNRSISWRSNDSVTLRFPGSTPPVGAFDFGSSVVSPPVGGLPPPGPPPPACPQAQTANPNASPDTKKLLNYIASLPSRPDARVISGQYISGPGSDGQLWPPNAYEDYVVRLHNETGKWVAMVGMDYAGVSLSNFSLADIQGVNQQLINYWNQGGLTHLLWTAPNPWGGTVRSNFDRVNVTELVTPGTAVNKTWMSMLDRVAGRLAELRGAGVVVLFRPFHEMNGGWFWWSFDNGARISPAQFTRLWRHMFNYFTVDKGLNNLIWEYGPDGEHIPLASWQKPALFYYPGDAYVDIVGLSVYSDTFDDWGGYSDLVALGKPFFFLEQGPRSQRCCGNWDTATVIRSIKERFPQTAGFLFWSDWSRNIMSIVTNRNAAGLLNDPWVITREELNWREADTSCPLPPPGPPPPGLPPPGPPPPPACSCDSFVQGGGCGAGLCNSFELQSTRSCSPSGCSEESRCDWEITCAWPTPTPRPPSPAGLLARVASITIFCGEGGNPLFTPSGRLWTAIGCIPIGETTAFTAFFLSWGIGIVGGITLILIIVSGFMIMTSQGNPQRLQAGRELLGAAIAGLILLIFSVFLLRVIGVDILGIL